MKSDSLADLGYIKLYLQGFLKDNPTLSQDPKKYNEFSIQRSLELIDAILSREKSTKIYMIVDYYYLFGDLTHETISLHTDKEKANEIANELRKKKNKYDGTISIQEYEVKE